MPLIGQAISPGVGGLVIINFLAKAFWRVLIIDGGSGTTGASEVRFKNKGVTKRDGDATGSGGTPGNAFDDSTSTNWTITGEFGEYVAMEFSGDFEVDEVDIVSLFNDNSNTLVDYAVQFSDDGVVWTTVWESRGNVPQTANGQAITSTRPFSPIGGAGLVNQRAAAIMGASPNAMINSMRAAVIMGASSDAMINSMRAYAIYDVGS